MTGLKEYLFERMKKGTIHLTLLDPDPEKLSEEKAKEIAVKMKEAGSDAFMIGGSTGVTSENLGAAAKAVRTASGLPAIYFPSNPRAVTSEVDGMFFMSILNSTDPLYISHGHAMVAPYVAKLGIETIPMAYIIIEPGMTVARVTKAKCVGHDDIDTAVGYALAAEMLGMLSGTTHQVYTGVTLCHRTAAGQIQQKTFHEMTKVTFYPMSEREISRYVSTRDCMDKAGAYGIQGFCARYIKEIEGDYNNVVGLPVGRLYQEAKEFLENEEGCHF